MALLRGVDPMNRLDPCLLQLGVNLGCGLKPLCGIFGEATIDEVFQVFGEVVSQLGDRNR